MSTLYQSSSVSPKGTCRNPSFSLFLYRIILRFYYLHYGAYGFEKQDKDEYSFSTKKKILVKYKLHI